MNAHTNYPKVTRIEVIDEKGRVYARYDVRVFTELQDDERTLKVFVGPNGKHEVRDQIIAGLAGTNGKLTDDHPLSG
jgi:hypothetical protein